MEQRLDIGLNSKLKEFSNKFSLKRENEKDEQNIFEHFVNYTITSNLLEDELENIYAVSTKQSQGIDGISIITNNRLITEESDLLKIGDNEKLKIEIGFIQATLEKSFNLKKLHSFVDEVVSFLTNSSEIEPYSSIYAKLLNEEGDYIDKLEDTPKVSLFFVSGRTNHQLSDSEIRKERNKITQRNELNGKIILNDLCFLQAEEIKKEYDKVPKYHSIQLKFDNNVQLDESEKIEFSLLATIKFSELKKLILTSNEKLRERLFIENVRSYIGNTNVNVDIKSTLDNNEYKTYFPYLNNGLTIMCDSIEKHKVKPNEFILSYPRIINGCQTTHIIFEKYNESPESVENIEVVTKVIATKDNDLKKQIIFAANNQNSIDKDLQSLNTFLEKIEEYFLGIDGMPLYFERLRGQHSQITPPYSRISIENLAKVYISVFLFEPHKMKSNAIKKINDYQTKKNVFNENDDPKDYYYCALLYYWLYYFVTNNEIELRSKTMDMHLIMTCDLELIKLEYNTTNEKILYLTSQDNAKDIFNKANNFINNQDYLFERRGFYSAPKTKQLVNNIKSD